MIGRKLNARLAELKMRSKETMSKQQLQKLFEHERDKELERLEGISVSAKKFGRAGDVVEMELDLEVGWAYQLLAKFGTLVELTLEPGCLTVELAEGKLRSQPRHSASPQFAFTSGCEIASLRRPAGSQRFRLRCVTLYRQKMNGPVTSKVLTE